MSPNNAKLNPAFRPILEDADPRQYASTRFVKNLAPTMPTSVEATSHLMLLRAFGTLHANVTLAIANETERNKKWQVYVTNAVRRFIIFVSAYKALRLHDLKSYCQLNQLNQFEHVRALRQMLPPLDILMVWHAFILNPKAFFDNCARNKIMDFGYFPFPLMRAVSAIDPYLFEYAPSVDERRLFADMVSAYQEDLVLDYHVTLATVLETNLRVYCPVCHQYISNVKYTTADGDGFADKDFRIYGLDKCPCAIDMQIYFTSHETLRTLQLRADTMGCTSNDQDLVLPNCHRYFSGILHPLLFSAQKPDSVSVTCKHIVQNLGPWLANATDRHQDLSTIVMKLCETPRFGRILKNLLRNYFEMNLIHTTVPRHRSKDPSAYVDVVEISEDLVGCVLRQQRFVDKMNQLDLLHSPMIVAAMYESSIRYERFFEMLTMKQKSKDRIIMVPTLDIDLFWHTHQLSMYYYLVKCITSTCQTFVDHNDKIEEGRLSHNFERTAKLYKSRYKQEYSICFCWYCLQTRVRDAKSGLKGLLTKKASVALDPRTYNKSFLFNWHDECGVTHISTHNYIQWPGEAGSRSRSQLQRQLPSQGIYPWQDDPYHRSSYSGMFVIAPMLPVTDETVHYWGPGACISTAAEGNGGGCGSDGGAGLCALTGPGGGAPCGAAFGPSRGSACGGGSVGGCGGGWSGGDGNGGGDGGGGGGGDGGDGGGGSSGGGGGDGGGGGGGGGCGGCGGG